MINAAREEAERLRKEFWEDVNASGGSAREIRGEALSEPVRAAGSAARAEGSRGEDTLRGAVLDEARRIINGDRQDMYGHAEDSFEDIAHLWSWWLAKMQPSPGNFIITPRDVAMMMALLKIAREAHNHKRDNIVDACGYLGLYSDLVDGRGLE